MKQAIQLQAARKPENHLLYRGHGFVVFAYAIRNPVTHENEWPVCVAKEFAGGGKDPGMSQRCYYHEVESALRDLKARLKGIVGEIGMADIRAEARDNAARLAEREGTPRS